MDTLLNAADITLRTLFAKPVATTPAPLPEAGAGTPEALSESQRREAGALMRVNHVGEVCAQALYAAQAAVTRNPALRQHFQAAGREETNHLAWTRQRLDALGSRPSLLNPVWYTGAFLLGLMAGRAGDATSLAFVAETEHQVGEHLSRHLERLPVEDTASRVIVSRMRDDELRHAAQARQAGAARLPLPIRGLMRAASKVMTVTAHRI